MNTSGMAVIRFPLVLSRFTNLLPDLASQSFIGEGDRCTSHLDVPLSHWQQEAPRAVKRKVDHVEIIEGTRQAVKISGCPVVKRGRMHTPTVSLGATCGICL